jgi:serine/threonine protein kinase/tetratricopeptide (TPR) repeat protein
MSTIEFERWQQVKEILHAALEREPMERAAFLAEACAGDEPLRREVASLLASHDEAEKFFRMPAVEDVTKIFVGEQPESMVGQHIGPYEVVSRIGTGGMGEIYLAKDARLGRKIALKLLPSLFTREPDRLRRFRQEARAVSALNHPNILTIHEIGQQDDAHFIATEYIEGQTLRERMANSSMKLLEVLDVAIQVASALAAAHKAGIVHRDVKPENVMLRADGYVKVLDFGIAKLTEKPSEGVPSNSDAATLVRTEPGMVMGTVTYMSPEQARGLPVDARTDIWSLGVVLYEMLAGHVPFEGPTISHVIVSILENKPVPLVGHREAEAELRRIVRKALHKDRERRYRTINDLLIDLRNLRQDLAFKARLKRPARSDKGSAGLSHAGGQPEVGSAVRPQGLSNFGRPAAYGKQRSRRAIDSLAVLPLANAGDDQNTEYLSDGITESVINSLSQLPGLRVVPRSTMFRYKGQEVDPQEVGWALNARAVITGRVRQVGDRLIIGIELVDVANDAQLWGESFNRKLSDIFEVQDEIAREVTEKLRLKLSGTEKRRLAKRPTEKTEAYQLYLKGRYHWNKRTEEALKKGIEYFQQAIEVDPTYALAFAGIAESFAALNSFGDLRPEECAPLAKSAAIKALELDDTLAEARTSLAYVKMAYDRDWSGAEADFKRALKLNPNYATAHDWYSAYLAGIGRQSEAAEEIRRAQELDPLSLIVNTGVGRQLFLAREYDLAIEQCLKTLELEPSFAPARWFMGRALGQQGKFDESISELKKAVEYSGGRTLMLASLGHAYAVSGRTAEAHEILERLQELSETRYVLPVGLAFVHAGLGKSEQAFHWLDKAYTDRASWMIFLKLEPEFDRLRPDPQFAELIRRMGLPS